MTYDEETFILKAIKRIRDETHENNLLLKENNKLLKQLINVANHNIANHNKENEYDFGRNVLANIFSNITDYKRLM